jgi:hypothetical protein
MANRYIAKSTARKNERLSRAQRSSKDGTSGRGVALPNNKRQHSEAPRAQVSKPKQSTGRGATALGAILGVIAGAGALATITWASGCGTESPPPGPTTEASSSADPFGGLPAPPVPPDDSKAPVVAEPDLPEPEIVDKPWEGPWLGALAQATPVYPTARFSRNRLGYVRRGSKVPVVDKPIKTASCKQGFYPLVDGGYVCGKYATTNVEDPRVKMGVKAPNIDALLPYRYAYNPGHGTPLYISVPLTDDMVKYEPYLKKKTDKKSRAEKEAEAAKDAEKADRPRVQPIASGSAAASATPSAAPASSAEPAQFLSPDAGLPGEAAGGAGAEEPPPPWWHAKKGDKVNVKLSDLNEGDGTMSKRMVKGFFIAIDRTFGWNNRMWYKTTHGLIAPADRMIIPKTPELQGFEIPDGVKQVGFIRGVKAFKYDWPEDDKVPKRNGKIKRFSAFGLTGKTRLYKKQRFRETVDGWWMKELHGTYTDPGERPKEVGADEKWIDVNLSRRTLLLFEGDKPVFAAIVSPGKKSKNKAKDHRTKTGKWRIREKHVTTTMDGDGPGGELPYSIQDVPYVQYYDGSYALHGAFWHNNFGREMSHGCVNLSPSDSKRVFSWTEPQLPRGWHGIWASAKRKGTMVVVHD